MKTKEDLLVSMLNTTGAKNIAIVIDEAEKNFNISWKPYGGNTANRSLVNAQQSEANGALIELLTNSMDAITERRLLELGLTKTIPGLPSVSEICDKFFAGNKEQMEKYASIRIIAEEKDAWEKGGVYPDIIIADNGTGQKPSDFERTLLSLSNGTRNKHNIPCMIGAYNMGSTGSINYCGNGGSTAYKLIVSKRHEGMNDGTSKEDLEKIGFTIIRETKVPGEDYIEYMVIDDEIPYITTDISSRITKKFYLQIDEPCTNRADRFVNKPGVEKAKFLDKGGTLIKLYTYQTTTPGVFDSEIATDLNTRLYAPVYSVFCCDTRDYTRNNRNTTVYGNYHRFAKDGSLDKHVKLRKNIVIEALLDGTMYKVPVSYYVLNKETKDARHLNKKGLLYTYNGQVQFSMGETFVSASQYLGFTSLRGLLLVVVDCTTLNKNKTFHSSREKILNNQYTRDLETAIINTLKADTELSEINREYTSSYGHSREDMELKRMWGYYGTAELAKILATSSKTPTVKPSSSASTAKTGRKTPLLKRSSAPRPLRAKITDDGFIIKLDNITESFFSSKSERIVIVITSKKDPSLKERLVISNAKDDDKIVGKKMFHYMHLFKKDRMEIVLSPMECKTGEKYEIHVRVESTLPKFRQEFKIEVDVLAKSAKAPFKVLYAYEDEKKVKSLGGATSGAISWKEIEDNGDWSMSKNLQNIIIKADETNSSKIGTVIINMDSNIFKAMVTKFTRSSHHTADDIMNSYKSTLITDSVYLHNTLLEIDPELDLDIIAKKMSNENYNRKLLVNIDTELYRRRSSKH